MKVLALPWAVISKFILHFLLTSSPSASYQGRMKVLLTSMNEMQIMMSLLKTLLFRSPEPSFFRNVLYLMCMRSATHHEIITTSGSILSILLRDQDVTVRPSVSIVISGRTKHGLDSQSTPPCLSFSHGVAGLLI